MASPSVVQANFRRMVRDLPRDRLPEDACWNLIDWIADEDAPAGKRGGFTYESPSLTAVDADANKALMVMYAPFAAGGQLLAISSNSADSGFTLSKIGSASAATAVGTGVFYPYQRPVFYRDRAILTGASGDAVKSYNGTTLASLGGSPPAAKYAAVWLDYLWLGNDGTNKERIWVSDPGDPTTWDTTNGWIDTTGVLVGLHPLRAALLCFHEDTVERIRGFEPPPGGDMIKERVGNAGLLDARSIAEYRDTIVFAGTDSVYQTDGAEIRDLIEEGGMRDYYQAQINAQASPNVAAGIYRNYYILVIRNGTSFVDCLMCYLPNVEWARWSNLPAINFWSRVEANDELYFAHFDAPRISSVSSCWAPAAGVKNDADGTAVTPVLETRFFKGDPGLKRFRHLYLNYDLRDAATDNPVLTASYITEPEGSSYTTVKDFNGASRTLPETTRFTRDRRDIRKMAEGIAFKVAQTNASATTKLYELELDARPVEKSRLRQ